MVTKEGEFAIGESGGGGGGADGGKGDRIRKGFRKEMIFKK